jgi:hypothetical protein
MSFVAEPGKVTALVAPLAAANPPLALLLWLYERDILIDGQVISGVSRKSRCRQTAYAGQDVCSATPL